MSETFWWVLMVLGFISWVMLMATISSIFGKNKNKENS